MCVCVYICMASPRTRACTSVKHRGGWEGVAFLPGIASLTCVQQCPMQRSGKHRRTHNSSAGWSSYGLPPWVNPDEDGVQ